MLAADQLAGVAHLVTPDTIRRWHRQWTAAKHTYQRNRVGQPGLMEAIRERIIRMAKDNARWGDCCIQGEMKRLGHNVAKSAIGKSRKGGGVPPSPRS